MQERLERAGVRPLYNVVDITNYVLLEMGQPLHAFDLAKLAGPEIRVRRAREGELLRTLDGKDRTLSTENLVIADRDRPVALAGVMGGEQSEVTESTKDVLLESAYFDPYRVQVTANSLTLMTEASRRFGRGVDPNLPPVAAARAAGLLEDIAGGTVELPASESAVRRFEKRLVTVRPEKVSALLGVGIPTSEMVRSLESLGFEVSGEEPLEVLAPTHRGDIAEPVDIIEEIGRAYGYERLPDAPISTGMHGPEENPEWDFQQLVRESMVGLGFTEALTPTLGDPQKLTLTWELTHDDDEGPPSFVELINPPSPRAKALRTDLAAGLLDVVARHLNHGAASTRVFEIGRVFRSSGSDDEPRPLERLQLAFAVSGTVDPRSWEEERDYDFYDAKGYAEALLARLGVDIPGLEIYSSPAWKSGEAAELRASSRVGWVGCFAPKRAHAWKLERPVLLFLAALDDIRAASRKAGRFTVFSRFPGVKRDLAFFVPDAATHAEIVTRMHKAAGKLLDSVRLFDVYRGRGVPEGQKSLAYSLVFSDPERTLQESEIESLQEQIVRALAKHLGATLRERPTRG
jgi:phenylalanyl-tRNA synthetase beta chain